MNKKLYFISRDPAGCFGCRWLIGTESEAKAAGHIHESASHELTPQLIGYLGGGGGFETVRTGRRAFHYRLNCDYDYAKQRFDQRGASRASSQQ